MESNLKTQLKADFWSDRRSGRHILDVRLTLILQNVSYDQYNNHRKTATTALQRGSGNYFRMDVQVVRWVLLGLLAVEPADAIVVPLATTLW